MKPTKPAPPDPWAHVKTPPTNPVWWLCVRAPRSNTDCTLIPASEGEHALPIDVDRYLFIMSRTAFVAKQIAMVELQAEPWEVTVTMNTREEVYPRTPRGMRDVKVRGLQIPMVVRHKRIKASERAKALIEALNGEGKPLVVNGALQVAIVRVANAIDAAADAAPADEGTKPEGGWNP